MFAEWATFVDNVMPVLVIDLLSSLVPLSSCQSPSFNHHKSSNIHQARPGRSRPSIS